MQHAILQVAYLELNVTAFRQLNLQGPNVAIIPLHLGSTAKIPISKRGVTANNLMAFPKRHLHRNAPSLDQAGEWCTGGMLYCPQSAVK